MLYISKHILCSANQQLLLHCGVSLKGKWGGECLPQPNIFSFVPFPFSMKPQSHLLMQAEQR